MKFVSLTFLLFLIVVWITYWLIGNRRGQNALILVVSYGFYAWWDWRFCGLMLASTVVDYFVPLAMDRTTKSSHRKMLLALSCTANLGMLGFFKYFNFFAESLAQLAQGLGWSFDPITLKVILPAGISFYTFQTMSYTIDVYRRVMPANRSFVDYAAYVSFFPQLVAGPIERGDRLLPQFMRERHFDEERARDGVRQCLWGMVKKMVVADTLAGIVNPVYGNVEAYTGPQLAFATICFAFQIYCDFSAYSDIAIGTAKLFGIELMRNFAFPYFSTNLSEFWRRWHISLSTWFRDYVYIPLGGSRLGKVRASINLLATFLISGLWHGADWTFVIWGGIHGLGVLPFSVWRTKRRTQDDIPGGPRLIPEARTVAAMLFTFVIATMAWVFFRADSVHDAMYVFSRIASDVGSLTGFTAEGLSKRTAAFGALCILALVITEWVTRAKPHPFWYVKSWPVGLRWSFYSLVIWGSVFLSPPQANPFIYFQF